MKKDQWLVNHAKYTNAHMEDVIQTMWEVGFIFSLVLFILTDMEI